MKPFKTALSRTVLKRSKKKGRRFYPVSFKMKRLNAVGFGELMVQIIWLADGLVAFASEFPWRYCPVFQTSKAGGSPTLVTFIRPDQAITHAGFGRYQLGTAGIFLQFFPQVRHVYAEVVRLFTGIGAPDFRKQMPVR